MPISTGWQSEVQPPQICSTSQLNSSCDSGTNPKRAEEPHSLELCQHMVLEPYCPTSASPSHPSMHCLDMHRSYLQGMSCSWNCFDAGSQSRDSAVSLMQRSSGVFSYSSLVGFLEGTPCNSRGMHKIHIGQSSHSACLITEQ